MLDTAGHYFTEYFGKKNKSIITDRLAATNIYFVGPKLKPAEKLSQFFAVLGDHSMQHLKKPFDELSWDFVNDCVDGVAAGERTGGMCIYIPFKKGGGRHGVFVHDVEGTELERGEEDAFTDCCINHELLHAVTQYEKNKKVISGISNFNYNLNEWVVENMAIEITKRIHYDNIVFNTRVRPSDAEYYLSPILKIIPGYVFEQYKDSLKRMMFNGPSRKVLGRFL